MHQDKSTTLLRRRRRRSKFWQEYNRDTGFMLMDAETLGNGDAKGKGKEKGKDESKGKNKALDLWPKKWLILLNVF